VSEIRDYLDENVASAIGQGLRRRGIDVLTVPEARTRGDDDPNQLALAHRLNRVLFTHDADHFSLAAAGQPHSGIVFAPQMTAAGS
jgi:predicted nuclease of predicted toxin-antitoxin system